MYLKSLEIRGFKSFADRTVLTFKSGITGVVGPNGSGKSNIADAVRWVLGEQSVKQLRGGRMEDVIFAGTQYRKSLGQAMVSLTLDNSCGTLSLPYNEVTVTRKLFRSGESEYLINNSQVRMKDIHELFMDTGIGKEGYSMIGQGKIDAILSGKTEERRSLVEEAAGITKYKSRKEEGEKKLKNADENLSRVEDIISTYEGRIEPLRQDKEKAEQFLEYSAELKTLQVSVIVSDLQDMDQKNEGLVKAREEQSAAFLAAETARQEAEAKTAELETELNGAAERRNQSKEAYYLKKSELDEVVNDLRFGETRLHSDSEKLKKTQAEILETEQRKKTVEDEEQAEAERIRQCGLELSAVAARLTDLKNSSAALEDDIRKTQEQTGAHRQEEEKLSTALRQVNDELSAARGKKEYLAGRKVNLNSVSENFTASLKLNQDGHERIALEISALAAKHAAIGKTVSETRAEADRLKDQRQAAEEAAEKVKRELRDAQTKLNMLKNLEDSYEGYTRSVKDLMTYLKKTNSRYAGETSIVGEIIKTEPRYTLAMEAALGGFIGNVITATDQQAKDLIGILKTHNMGRCTFLPRNVIKANRIKLPAFKTARVLGFAAELVQTEPQYREIIDSILARTLVVETMNEAVNAARETGYKIKIVTLEGDVIASGGAMTGGSAKTQKAGIITRKAEIETLETGIAENRQRSEGMNQQIAHLRQRVEAVYARLEEQTAAQRGNELEMAKAAEREAGFVREIERIRQLVANQGEEARSVKDALTESLAVINQLETNREKIEAALKTIAEKIDGAKQIRTDKFKANDDLKEAITEVRVEYTEKDRDLRGAEDHYASLGREREGIEERLAKLKGEAADLELVTFELTNELALLRVKQVELEQLMAALDADTLKAEGEETRIRSLIRDQSGHLAVLRDEYYRAERELYKTSLSLEKYETDRGELIEKLNEDMALTLAEAYDLAENLESKPKARKRITDIKGLISGLGTVNLSAIEEYVKVCASYQYLVEQRDDLNRAKAELAELIGEMTGRMKALFNENFVILSKNFKETFRQLFSGGQAELILGGGDELTGSIDIIVQPPGKKLQNLNLLSGGEKVLSAIALTFAILKMKPSPFCLLDEIEAALDDSNVYRYASFLKDYARDTQFILITHRKGTMEAANMLYGVTMEEKGISKIVSVDLDHIKGQG